MKRVLFLDSEWFNSSVRASLSLLDLNDTDLRLPLVMQTYVQFFLEWTKGMIRGEIGNCLTTKGHIPGRLHQTEQSAGL